jgi:hypothetical protein
MEVRLQPEQSADTLAQQVMNAWGQTFSARELLPKDFKALFEKAYAYQSAKEDADNHRQFNWLTDKDVAREQAKRREFLESDRAFRKNHR